MIISIRLCVIVRYCEYSLCFAVASHCLNVSLDLPERPQATNRNRSNFACFFSHLSTIEWQTQSQSISAVYKTVSTSIHLERACFELSR